MSLPAVFGANLLELIDVAKEGGFQMELLPMYLVGMAVAGVVGILCDPAGKPAGGQR